MGYDVSKVKAAVDLVFKSIEHVARFVPSLEAKLEAMNEACDCQIETFAAQLSATPSWLNVVDLIITTLMGLFPQEAALLSWLKTILDGIFGAAPPLHL